MRGGQLGEPLHVGPAQWVSDEQVDAVELLLAHEVEEQRRLAHARREAARARKKGRAPVGGTGLLSSDNEDDDGQQEEGGTSCSCCSASYTIGEENEEEGETQNEKESGKCYSSRFAPLKFPLGHCWWLVKQKNDISPGDKILLTWQTLHRL